MPGSCTSALPGRRARPHHPLAWPTPVVQYDNAQGCLQLHTRTPLPRPYAAHVLQESQDSRQASSPDIFQGCFSYWGLLTSCNGPPRPARHLEVKHESPRQQTEGTQVSITVVLVTCPCRILPFRDCSAISAARWSMYWTKPYPALIPVSLSLMIFISPTGPRVPKISCAARITSTHWSRGLERPMCSQRGDQEVDGTSGQPGVARSWGSQARGWQLLERYAHLQHGLSRQGVQVSDVECPPLGACALHPGRWAGPLGSFDRDDSF